MKPIMAYIFGACGAALVSVALIGFSLSFVGGQTSAVYWQFLKVGRLKRHGTRAMRSSAGGADNLILVKTLCTRCDCIH